MFAISLTSIPPRFHQLPLVIKSLAAQTCRPDHIFLTIPQNYQRFETTEPLPSLPDVTILRPDTDPGPAGKVLLAAQELSPDDDLIYCDDDWHYAPNWAEALFATRPASDCVVAAAHFPLCRLKRQGGQIAQGFAGILIRAGYIPSEAYDIPEVAWPVDDIWLSGHYTRQGLPIIAAPDARAACRTLNDPANLQEAWLNAQSRAEANQACAALMHKRYGIWPPLKR